MEPLGHLPVAWDRSDTNDRRGRLIVLEGPDGVGKGEHTRRLVAALGQRGLVVEAMREPTEGMVGRRARAFGPTLPWRTAALLFATDRAEHGGAIASALARGRWVVCDRYDLSNILYAAARAATEGGDGDEAARWAALVEAAAVRPDLYVVLDAPDEVLDARIASRGDPDTYDLAPWRWRTRVLYRTASVLLPDRRIVHVQADGAPTVTADLVLAAVLGAFPEVCRG